MAACLSGGRSGTWFVARRPEVTVGLPGMVGSGRFSVNGDMEVRTTNRTIDLSVMNRGERQANRAARDGAGRAHGPVAVTARWAIVLAVLVTTVAACARQPFTISNVATDGSVTVTVVVHEWPLPERFDPSGTATFEMSVGSVRPVPGLPDDRCVNATATAVSESGGEATYPSPLCNDDLWSLRNEPGF